jgi:hypothetical protein
VRRIVQNALLVAFGLLVGLLILEGAIRLAALVLPTQLERARSASASLGSDETTILCIGDSHTYGVGVSAEEAYPSQLERALRRHGVKARIVNAGIPGRNTGQLLEALPASIARYRPQIVIMWAGANNQWVPLDASARPALRFRDHIRLFRLLRLLLRRYEGVSGDFRGELQVALGQVDPADLSGPTGKRELRAAEPVTEMTLRDLGSAIDVVRRAGAIPVLVTYPVPLGPIMGHIDEAIESAGGTHDARVVDTRAVVRRHRPRQSKLLLPDMHPNARLHRAIGWEIGRVLVRERVVAVGDPTAQSRKAPLGEPQ